MLSNSFNLQISLILKNVKCLLDTDYIDNAECSILAKVLTLNTSLTHLIIGRVENPELLINAIHNNFNLIYINCNLDKTITDIYVNRNINYNEIKDSLDMFANISNIPPELIDIIYEKALIYCCYRIPKHFVYLKY